MSNQTHNHSGDILLDAGTNELEVLVFVLAGGWYGVNVAKVREVIRKQSTIAAPHQHPSVIGMFNIRGSVLPVVDLGKHLALRPVPNHAKVSPSKSTGATARADADREHTRVIIMEFNGGRCGFLVDGVEQIHRMSWARVRPAPDVQALDSSGLQIAVSATTGIIELNNRLVQMIDFESVANSITTPDKLKVQAVENTLGVNRSAQRVIVAEDSPFMRGLIKAAFVASGYSLVEVYSDGQAAWDAIADPTAGPIAAVVSDIEMPRIDGLHLTRRIRESGPTKLVPVLLFSSLISDDNKKKGEQVGATAQLAKPELAEIVRMVDRVIHGLSPMGQTLDARPAQRAA